MLHWSQPMLEYSASSALCSLKKGEENGFILESGFPIRCDRACTSPVVGIAFPTPPSCLLCVTMLTRHSCGVPLFCIALPIKPHLLFGRWGNFFAFMYTFHAGLDKSPKLSWDSCIKQRFMLYYN